MVFVKTYNLRFSLRRFSQCAEKVEQCIAIRRESINVWERRAPLAPLHVKELTKVFDTFIFSC